MPKRKSTSEINFCPSKIQRDQKSVSDYFERKSQKCKMKEKQGDLFDVSSKYSLAHCVAEDMHMSSGIAVGFRQKFKRVAHLLNQNVKMGGVAVLKNKKRFIYYLVTKQFSNGKPTYASLNSSLKMLRREVVENKVRRLAIPKIGCGLDLLEWDKVKCMIEDIFRDIKIKINIFELPKTTIGKFPQQHRRNKVTNLSHPINKIERNTLIIYLSSEDGELTSEMEALNKRFHFASTFHNSEKVLGNVIFFPTRDGNNVLCGCIAKKHYHHSLDFEAFEKCLQRIQEANEIFRLDCIAMQGLRDGNDFTLMSKIINILQNNVKSNHKVSICWPQDLRQMLRRRTV